jgi:hypothetical protein
VPTINDYIIYELSLPGAKKVKKTLGYVLKENCDSVKHVALLDKSVVPKPMHKQLVAKARASGKADSSHYRCVPLVQQQLSHYGGVGHSR